MPGTRIINKRVEKAILRKRKQRFERKYLPDFVYGGMDGTITTFSVVSGVIGASLSSAVILILGFANIFADGFSIAISNYFSIKSKNELIKNQDKHPTKAATATFLAFLLMGLIPLLPFMIASITKASFLIGNQFVYSIILTGVALTIIGWYKGEVTGKHKIKSALQSLVIGGIAATLAFLVGLIISHII